MKWMPRDIIALVVIIIAATLLHRGIDTVVGWSLIGVVAGYFGIAVPSLVKVIKNSQAKKEE
uniref:Uncharacterized protein n=1 Tax=viral metagenome TaxID=1070528 RepID=A0A6M3M5W1_9ZZZZ